MQYELPGLVAGRPAGVAVAGWPGRPVFFKMAGWPAGRPAVFGRFSRNRPNGPNGRLAGLAGFRPAGQPAGRPTSPAAHHPVSGDTGYVAGPNTLLRLSDIGKPRSSKYRKTLVY
eukprot:gene18006-biopygen5213